MKAKKGYIVASTKRGHYQNRPGIVREIYRANINPCNLLYVELLDCRQMIHISDNESERKIISKSLQEYKKAMIDHVNPVTEEGP